MPVPRYPTSIRLSKKEKTRLRRIASLSGHTLSSLVVFWTMQRLEAEERKNPPSPVATAAVPAGRQGKPARRESEEEDE